MLQNLNEVLGSEPSRPNGHTVYAKCLTRGAKSSSGSPQGEGMKVFLPVQLQHFCRTALEWLLGHKALNPVSSFMELAGCAPLWT